MLVLLCVFFFFEQYLKKRNRIKRKLKMTPSNIDAWHFELQYVLATLETTRMMTTATTGARIRVSYLHSKSASAWQHPTTDCHVKKNKLTNNLSCITSPLSQWLCVRARASYILAKIYLTYKLMLQHSVIQLLWELLMSDSIFHFFFCCAFFFVFARPSSALTYLLEFSQTEH